MKDDTITINCKYVTNHYYLKKKNTQIVNIAVTSILHTHDIQSDEQSIVFLINHNTLFNIDMRLSFYNT